MQLSFIIPACNEEDTLNKSFNIAKKFLDKLGRYEIIIAVDGSTDRTKTIADEIAANNKMVRLMYSKKRLGKGLALKRASELQRVK
ncbi:MAG: glycosyltransferase [Candidatus Aenigmarchaeota archaeon]|nr:glycosyltransferase [Candidatus Aenigmarchaeota archaeon]